MSHTPRYNDVILGTCLTILTAVSNYFHHYYYTYRNIKTYLADILRAKICNK